MQLRLIILYVLSLMVANVSAQELVIREPFQMVPNDLTAAQAKYQKLDYNGNPCALVIVGLVDRSATFHGDVIHTEYKQGEWWVYMIEGSRYLKIKTDNYLPKETEFAPLKSKTTYKISFTFSTQKQVTAQTKPLLPYYVKKDNEWIMGYIDKNGNIAIPAKYKGFGSLFQDGTASIDNEGYSVFINSDGDIIDVPSRSYDGLHLIRVNHKYGYANKYGEIVIPVKYAYASDFREGRALVCEVRKDVHIWYSWRFINTKGEQLFNRSWSYAQEVKNYSEGYAAIYDGYKGWTYLDTNGIAQQQWGFFNGAGTFSEGLAPVENQESKWGYINRKGELVIPYQYGVVAHSFSDGLAKVADGLFSPYKFINKYGVVIIELGNQYDCDFDADFSEGLLCVKSKNTGKYGYIDHQGKEVIPCIFESASSFQQGFAKVDIKETSVKSKSVWIDKTGKVLKDKKGVPYCSMPQYAEGRL